jgi:RNA polymerase sigma-70 factor (ECF subfamily)
MVEDHEEKKKLFLSLYLPVNDRLARYVQSLVYDREDARDLVSETVATAFANLHKLRDQQAFLGYVFGIASRLIRQRERKKRLFDFFSRQELRRPQFETKPDSRLDMELFYLSLQKLSLKEREAIVMFELNDFSLKEIQELQQESSLSAVKSRLARARAKLARYMNVEEDASFISMNSNASPDKPILPNFKTKII